MITLLGGRGKKRGKSDSRAGYLREKQRLRCDYHQNVFSIGDTFAQTPWQCLDHGARRPPIIAMGGLAHGW
ncbi:hypothetical protein O4N73_22390 [Vibrio parahaemolyticus]|uniref:hypothetical protein n=1 Tax=Vibrio parahaemolyticus TaxID=670 RepID=UPI0022B53B83|nr:hypothetical protein [Vibrio parahaemolyticus]MCZ5879879.1 hypothetical protein [Vibrio parahaemolyticus]MCZ6371912.1 hypothetical protein [Vibrio parahaemolyticus]